MVVPSAFHFLVNYSSSHFDPKIWCGIIIIGRFEKKTANNRRLPHVLKQCVKEKHIELTHGCIWSCEDSYNDRSS